MAGFYLAIYEQGYHYYWGNDQDYWNFELHQKLLWVWIVIGGCFLTIGSVLIARFFLKSL